jgi:signal transduction histidine kinase
MFLNLLSKAVKFTPDGGRVVVHARSCDDGVLISIEDSGIGIDPEEIDKVLSPFGQVKSAAIGVEDGTGLGLPIVKSLIELHGGRFDIQSSPGVGTTVALYFPLQRVVQVAACRETWNQKPSNSDGLAA